MHLRVIRLKVLIALAVAIALSPAYGTTLAQFDLTTFNSLTQQPLTQVDLTQAPPYNYSSTGVTLDLVTFIGLQNPGYYLGFSNGVINAPGAGGILRIILPAGVTAVSMNLATSTGTVTVKSSTGDTVTGPSSSSLTFFGVTSDVTIASLDISTSQGTLQLSNFQYGSVTTQTDAPPVAEGATMILIGSGLVALPLLRRAKCLFPA